MLKISKNSISIESKSITETVKDVINIFNDISKKNINIKEMKIYHIHEGISGELTFKEIEKIFPNMNLYVKTRIESNKKYIEISYFFQINNDGKIIPTFEDISEFEISCKEIDRWPDYYKTIKKTSEQMKNLIIGILEMVIEKKFI